jgi:hypothetical protein
VTAVALRTDGPHSPDYTRELGNVFAEVVRCLNYATRDDAPGLDDVGDACVLLGALYSGTGRLQQLMTQAVAFLEAERDRPGLADDRGRDPAGQIAAAAFHLGAAHQLAVQVTAELWAARHCISGLYVKEGTDEHA